MSRADHRPYVHAVADVLDETGLPVLSSSAPAPPGDLAARTGRISIDAPDGGPFADDPEIALVWDESYGWKAEHGAEHGPNNWFLGAPIVPRPGRVARWLQMLLDRPDLTPSHEEPHARLAEQVDPEIEAQLTAYVRVP